MRAGRLFAWEEKLGVLNLVFTEPGEEVLTLTVSLGEMGLVVSGAVRPVAWRLPDGRSGSGRLTIGRLTLSMERMGLTLTDTASNTQMLEAELSPEALMRAIREKPSPVQYELRVERAGLRHEHKTEIVPGGIQGGANDLDGARQRLAPFEVDGWRGQPDDLRNPHRKRKGGMEVSFDRWTGGEGQ